MISSQNDKKVFILFFYPFKDTIRVYLTEYEHVFVSNQILNRSFPRIHHVYNCGLLF